MRLSRVLGPSMHMVVGLGLFGLAGYVYVAVTGATLSNSDANLAIAFYFIVNVVGPGIFYALEQVTSRATSHATATGRPVGSALRRIRNPGIGLVVAVTVGLVALAPILGGATLHGDRGLYAQVLVTPVIAAGLHVVRGLLGGRQRFGAYAMTLAVEGIARMALCVLLAVTGAGAAWTYGVAYLAGSVLAIVIGLVLLRRGRTAVPDAPVEAAAGPAEHASVGRGLAALAVATLLAQLLPNLAPLAVTSRLAQDSAVALAFGQAVVIARIPTLLFFPVQTMLLPRLSAAVSTGATAVVARITKLTMAGVAVAGAAWIGAFVVLGPWVLRTFLGATVDLDASIMLLLALSTVVLIAAFATQPALVALHRDHAVTAAWAIGSAVTLALVLLPTDPVVAASVAQVIGPALALLTGVLALRAALRTPPAADGDGSAPALSRPGAAPLG